MKGENKSSMNNSIYNGIGLIEGWAINSQASYKPLLIDACNLFPGSGFFAGCCIIIMGQ
ncbi:MAG: hypothetical protein WBI12_01945 [Methanosarcina flavescens]|jgi:hypothetical protein